MGNFRRNILQTNFGGKRSLEYLQKKISYIKKKIDVKVRVRPWVAFFSLFKRNTFNNWSKSSYVS